MRKAEDIICEDIFPESDGWESVYRYNEVIKAIKIAQLEAIKETCKVCAENAKLVNVEIQYTGVRAGGSYFIKDIGKQSILNCAEILKKKIE